VTVRVCDSGRSVGQLVVVEQLQRDVWLWNQDPYSRLHGTVPQRTTMRRRFTPNGILQRQPLSRSVVDQGFSKGGGQSGDICGAKA